MWNMRMQLTLSESKRNRELETASEEGRFFPWNS